MIIVLVASCFVSVAVNEHSEAIGGEAYSEHFRVDRASSTLCHRVRRMCAFSSDFCLCFPDLCSFVLPSVVMKSTLGVEGVLQSFCLALRWII